MPRCPCLYFSNFTTAVLGVFLLWFGWFGFDGGSTVERSPEF
ncbi:MAG: hypothetical protein HC799_17400 [Limnothrix sp. RL_2_0]|nr:hypothetical protein [Limnothrix sp. RL_2_0]